MLKFFFEGTPSRQGCSHLIGHNIYENTGVQSKTTGRHLFKKKNPFFLWEFNMGKMDEK